jgi:hypothetical protein
MTTGANTLEETSLSIWSRPFPPESWPGAITGGVLFLVAGVDLILGEIPHEWGAPAWINTLQGIFFLLAMLILPAIGYGTGWVMHFPRWSYPYTGMLLLSSLYMMFVATPGLRIFGYTFGNKDLWLWRAWIPFLVASGTGLLLTRSFRPISEFFANGLRDWTLFTFTMFGWMPLIVAVGFDEMDRLLSLYCMIAATVIMTGTALLYLRSRNRWQQAATLFGGIFLTASGTKVVSTLYWGEDGWVDILRAIMAGALLAAFMVSPAVIQVFTGFAHKRT